MSFYDGSEHKTVPRTETWLGGTPQFVGQWKSTATTTLSVSPESVAGLEVTSNYKARPVHGDDAMRALMERIDKLEEAARTHDVRMEGSDPAADEEAMTLDVTVTYNLYSWAVERALSGEVSLSKNVEGLLYLLILFFVQIIFAEGLFDTSMLVGDSGNSAAFEPTLNVIWLYPSTRVNVDGKVPLINVCASSVSLALMTLIMFQDNFGTLLTTCPLETLLLPPLPLAGRRPTAKPTTTAARVLHGITCLLLQCFYSLRAAVLPAMCSLATANILAASDNALDIVLST